MIPNAVLPYPFLTVKPDELSVPVMKAERSILLQGILNQPYGIAAMPNGNVFVGMKNGTIVQIRLNPARVVETYDIGATPYGLRVCMMMNVMTL